MVKSKLLSNIKTIIAFLFLLLLYSINISIIHADGPVAPTVSTDSADNIDFQTESLNGTMQDNGGDSEMTDVGFQYSTDMSYGNSVSLGGGTYNNADSFNSEVSSLACSTLYHFRAYAINAEGENYGDDMTFTTDNCLLPNLVSANVDYGILILNFENTLDSNSVPLSSDFVMKVNNNPVNISNVSVSDTRVILTLTNYVAVNDAVSITYTPGANLIKSLSGNSNSGFSNQIVTNNTSCGHFPVGSNPRYSVLVGTNLYVANSNSNSISVVNTLNDNITSTIPLSINPSTLILVGTKLYVTGFSNNVLVIDTSNNTVTDTISLASNARFPILVGAKIYITNYSNGVSVIDTANNNSVTYISVGSNPQYPTLVGSKLYINNQNSNNVSVIDTANDTVTATIPVGTNPQYSTLVGTNLYVSNRGDNTVSVINTTTNTVVATIPVGVAPYYSVAVGSKLYVSNQNSLSVSVINTTNNTVVATVGVGLNPQVAILAGTKLYVNNQNSNNVSVIDTTNDTLYATINVGSLPQFPTLVGPKLYVNNQNSNNITIIDTLTNTMFVCGTSYNFTCAYTANSNGTITGSANQTVYYGNNASPVTAVPNSGYHFVNWSDSSTSNPRTDTNVTSNISVAANFAADAAVVTPSSSSSYSSGGHSSYYGGQPVMIASNLPTIKSVQVPTVTSYKFLYDHQLNDSSNEIKLLQMYLNKKGFTVSVYNAGSPGKESTFFGLKTYLALKKFQKSVGLPATGYFGKLTRAYINRN